MKIREAVFAHYKKKVLVIGLEMNHDLLVIINNLYLVHYLCQALAEGMIRSCNFRRIGITKLIII